jgi:hypothetical protein
MYLFSVTSNRPRGRRRPRSADGGEIEDEEDWAKTLPMNWKNCL